jgi:hypothetical protein
VVRSDDGEEAEIKERAMQLSSPQFPYVRVILISLAATFFAVCTYVFTVPAKTSLAVVVLFNTLMWGVGLIISLFINIMNCMEKVLPASCMDAFGSFSHSLVDVAHFVKEQNAGLEVGFGLAVLLALNQGLNVDMWASIYLYARLLQISSMVFRIPSLFFQLFFAVGWIAIIAILKSVLISEVALQSLSEVAPDIQTPAGV